MEIAPKKIKIGGYNREVHQGDILTSKQRIDAVKAIDQYAKDVNDFLNAKAGFLKIGLIDEFGNREPKNLVRGFKPGVYISEPTIKHIEPQCPTCGAWSITNHRCDYCGNKY